MNKQTGTLLLFALIAVLPAVGQTQSWSRKKTSLDENWKFHFGHAANAEKDFNYSIATIFAKSGAAAGTAIDPLFPDSGWRTVNVPHDWAVELPFVYVQNANVESHGYKPVGGLFPETSIGWYRKHFLVNAADSGTRFQLQFDGVFRDANIWINGFFVGNMRSGYIGSTFDITDYINYHGENILVVRADATQSEGWFYEGAGIYRHVWLNQYHNVHVPDGGLFASSTIDRGAATVTVQTMVENLGLVSDHCSVYAYLTDREGRMLSQTKEQAIAVVSNGRQTIQQKLAIKNPRLWSLNDPYLYRVVAVIKSGDAVIDEVKTRFGFRTFRFDAAQGFFLNGEHVKLKGTNNHQDHAGLGTALPDYMHYYRLRLLKNLGANAVRTSHNPPAPEFLDACDSLGMLVLDENRLLNSSPTYLEDFQKMILRDRNHASIFIWSIGNEEGWIQSNSAGKRIAQSLIARQNELDPSRTCTYAADLGNEFKGINEVIPVRGFNYRHRAVADYHRDHPQQPIVGTEMGSTVTTRGQYAIDSIRGYLPDEDITAPWWASKAEDWWPLAAVNDFWAGGFVWTGFDYRGEPTPFSWPNINSHFGIMDMCGFPKNIYYYYQGWWSNKDVLHISPHRNWAEKRNQPVDVWLNTNADTAELVLNGKSLGARPMPRNGHLQWTVNYQPGKLEAIAHKNGKEIRSVVETAGPPAEVVMTPYKTTMLADGSDVSVINLSVVDHEGRDVPNAGNMISFSITGPGRMIGVGNGDPSSHEPDKCPDGAWQRSLFEGHCQVIVQSTRQAGTIHFVAHAAGLLPGSTDIVTVNPDNYTAINIDKQFVLSGEAAKPRATPQMMGADISFLPQLEDRGIKFTDEGQPKDAVQLLKDHGFNFVRLRIFNDPSNDSGYSPHQGFCDLKHTMAMAKRVKNAGMKLLLDFHYSDTWADPGKQFKPAAWKGQDFSQLKKSLFDYTRQVMQSLKEQGTLPDMVQVGNEINHGLVWPEGSIEHPDSMAQLLAAGIAAVKSVSANTVIMLHIALGGQNDESVAFLQTVLARQIPFDVIGLSYYPKWHGTIDDLRDNMDDLANRFRKDVIVVEYSAKKQEVNRTAFGVYGGFGKGTCIWEPLNTWESITDRNGASNAYLKWYDVMSKEYLK